MHLFPYFKACSFTKSGGVFPIQSHFQEEFIANVHIFKRSSHFRRQKKEKFRLFNVLTTKHPYTHHGHIPYLSPVKSLHIYWSMATFAVQDTILCGIRYHLKQLKMPSCAAKQRELQFIGRWVPGAKVLSADIEKHRCYQQHQSTGTRIWEWFI